MTSGQVTETGRSHLTYSKKGLSSIVLHEDKTGREKAERQERVLCLTSDHSRTFWHILVTSPDSAYAAPTKDPMLVPPTMSIGIPARMFSEMYEIVTMAHYLGKLSLAHVHTHIAQNAHYPRDMYLQ